MEAIIFKPLPFQHLLLPNPFPLPLTKNEKMNVDNFFNFCGSVACLLQHFIILREQNIPLMLLLYLLYLSLLFRTTLCFFFLDIRTCVECRTVLFNIFVIAEPLMYFCVCHGATNHKNLKITNCLKKIKHLVTTIQKIIKHFNK